MEAASMSMMPAAVATTLPVLIVSIQETTQERHQCLLARWIERSECVPRSSTLSIVSEDRITKRARPTVVQELCSLGDSPQRHGAPLIACGRALRNRIGKRRPHMVQEEVGIKIDGLACTWPGQRRRMATRTARRLKDRGAWRGGACRRRRWRIDAVQEFGAGLQDQRIHLWAVTVRVTGLYFIPPLQRIRHPDFIAERISHEFDNRRHVCLPAELPHATVRQQIRPSLNSRGF